MLCDLNLLKFIETCFMLQCVVYLGNCSTVCLKRMYILCSVAECSININEVYVVDCVIQICSTTDVLFTCSINY